MELLFREFIKNSSLLALGGFLGILVVTSVQIQII